MTKKKKILVHEIKIFFFFITWSSFMWIYGGGIYCPAVPEEYLETQQEIQVACMVLSSWAIQQMVLLFSSRSSRRKEKG